MIPKRTSVFFYLILLSGLVLPQFLFAQTSKEFLICTVVQDKIVGGDRVLAKEGDKACFDDPVAVSMLALQVDKEYDGIQYTCGKANSGSCPQSSKCNCIVKFSVEETHIQFDFQTGAEKTVLNTCEFQKQQTLTIPRTMYALDWFRSLAEDDVCYKNNKKDVDLAFSGEQINLRSDSDCRAALLNKAKGSGNQNDPKIGISISCTLEKGGIEEAGTPAATRLGIETLNQLGTTSLPQLIGRGISIITGLIGAVALGVFIFGGFMWMLSMGNPERVKKAQAMLLWGGLGTMVILASYAIVTFLFDIF